MRVRPSAWRKQLGAGAAPPGLSMYGRALWQIGRDPHLSGACGRPDDAVGRSEGALRHYFAARIAPYARDIEQLAATAKQQRLTEFETYLLNRLAGEGGRLPLARRAAVPRRREDLRDDRRCRRSRPHAVPDALLRATTGARPAERVLPSPPAANQRSARS